MTPEKFAQLRAEFERIASLPDVKEKIDFPLQTMETNGAFHHYMDSDTDSAWTGFVWGWIASNRAALSSNGNPKGSADGEGV